MYIGNLTPRKDLSLCEAVPPFWKSWKNRWSSVCETIFTSFGTVEKVGFCEALAYLWKVIFILFRLYLFLPCISYFDLLTVGINCGYIGIICSFGCKHYNNRISSNNSIPTNSQPTHTHTYTYKITTLIKLSRAHPLFKKSIIIIHCLP